MPMFFITYLNCHVPCAGTKALESNIVKKVRSISMRMLCLDGMSHHNICACVYLQF